MSPNYGIPNIGHDPQVELPTRSTETTFYVLAVYMGSVGVARYRHALPAGLLADLVGFAAAVVVVRAVFG